MTFSELTWNQIQQEARWQVEYEAPNGYVLLVHTSATEAATSPTDPGVTYICETYSWDRTTDSEPLNIQDDLDAEGVQYCIDWVTNAADPEPEVDLNEIEVIFDPDPRGDISWD